MTEFPLIKAMGLEVQWAQETFRPGSDGRIGIVRASDLEKTLECAPKVHGHRKTKHGGWGFDQQGEIEGVSSHTARLICIEPIIKPPTYDELLEENRRLKKLLAGEEVMLPVRNPSHSMVITGIRDARE